MKLLYRIKTVVVLLLLCHTSFAGPIIENLGVATKPVILYASPSFDSDKVGFAEALTVFEIQAITTDLHFDQQEVNRFPWIRAVSSNGNGWVYGANLAVIEKNQDIDKWFRNYHRQFKSFEGPFKNSNLWIAKVMGQQLVENHEDVINYEKKYVVISNKDGHATLLPFESNTFQRALKLKRFYLMDLTGDSYPELSFESTITDLQTKKDSSFISIYSIGKNGFTSIFNADLTNSDGVQELASNHQVNVSPNRIKVVKNTFKYCSYLLHEDLSIDPSGICLDQSIAEYSFQAGSNQFEIIGGIQKLKPVATIKGAESNVTVLSLHYNNDSQQAPNFTVNDSNGESRIIAGDLIQFQDPSIDQMVRNFSQTTQSISSIRNNVQFTSASK